jgi:hypothetical protein
MELSADNLAENVTFFGRTFFDKEKKVMFFNWTNSGFEMTFHGNKVEIELEGQADCYPTEGTNLPWITIFINGSHEPSSVLNIREGTNSYTLFEGREKETHILKVVKRSENSKGRVGIKKVIIEGEILPAKDRRPRYRLEFIGDSITCGFGNEMDGSDETFSTALEDGLKTYSAIAADLLQADYHSICISGIPLCGSYNKDFRIVLPGFPDFNTPPPAMEDYYEYTDRFQQEASGVKSGFQIWDFNRFKPDAIVINLGTNDAFRVKASGNDPEEERHFEKQYKEFLQTLRRLNGELPVIACTLGSMDYYLYDNILRAVEGYKAETGDKRVFCYKYGGMFLWGEGTGGLGHPSIKAHERMGKELAEEMKKWL